MTLTIVKENLIYADERYIMHGCNAQGKMGSGVAKALRDRWPEVYKPYKEYCGNSKDNGADILGTVLPVVCENKIILNAISQQFYGYDGNRYVSYDAIDTIIQELTYRLPKDTEIAMSQIGSSLGGGSWEVIEKIIEDRNKDWLKFKVYVV